jgi:hypothetical protein
MKSWRVLARRIAARLPPGFVRFQTAATDHTRLDVLAFYLAAAPEVAPFTLTIGSAQLRVEVRTRALSAPPRPRSFDAFERSVATPGVVFTGVHPGAAIAIDLGNGAHELGAICVLLSRDPAAAQPTHLITCGHMFPPRSKATDVIAGQLGEEAVIGQLVVNLLERAQQRRDVALIKLTPTGSEWATAKSPGPKLGDYFPANRVFHRSARTFQPTTGKYSPETRTAGDTVSAVVTSKQWPGGFAVEGVISTESAVSKPGDSGTILAAVDAPIAIGSCSASDGGQSLFEPVGRVIDDVLAPRYQLTLWRNR